MHCFEIKWGYNDYKKEFLGTFYLKAFPGESIGFSGNSGFNFDAIGNSLRNEAYGEKQTR